MIHSDILYIINSVAVFDDIELDHKADAIDWVRSGAEIFRISKPDNPPKHLVSYFVPYDEYEHKILLINHIKSGLWLPPGGHVDINEHPKTTVIREAEEELGINAKFTTNYGDKPFFITVTKTIGYGEHTDVSLWYVITGDSTKILNYEKREMHGYKWYTPNEILNTDISKLDPHMHRFTRKLLEA